jgi:predicted HTH transcriptional regulator
MQCNCKSSQKIYTYRGADKSLSTTTSEITEQIHELILEDRRISAKSIAEQLGISRERVGFIIHEDLNMLVACFLPGRAKDVSASLYIALFP